jgi:hypothetical protein
VRCIGGKPHPYYIRAWQADPLDGRGGPCVALALKSTLRRGTSTFSPIRSSLTAYKCISNEVCRTCRTCITCVRCIAMLPLASKWEMFQGRFLCPKGPPGLHTGPEDGGSRSRSGRAAGDCLNSIGTSMVSKNPQETLNRILFATRYLDRHGFIWKST